MGVRIAGDSAQIAGPEVTGIAPGEPLTRALVRSAILKLFDSGRWVDVQVEAEPAANGVVLVFYLEPRISLRRIEVRGRTPSPSRSSGMRSGSRRAQRCGWMPWAR